MPLIKEILILSLIYYWFIAMASAEVTQLNIKPCKRGREFHAKSVVNEVTIGPCPVPGACNLYKGHNATITVKFTPSAQTPSDPCKLKSKLVWLSKIDMDFGEVSANACEYMNCPLEANKETVFNATFFISKMWPTGTYPLKLKVQENTGGKRVLFCQLFKVWITGQPSDLVLN